MVYFDEPRIKMTRLAALLLITLSVAFTALGAPEVGTCQNPVRLDAKASALKAAFNESGSDVRLVFVVDPICPACLRGIEEMNRTVLAPNTGEKQLKTFVVHMPVIGAKEIDTRRTCKLLTHGTVTHYWDDSGDFGWSLSSVLELKTKKGERVYAWDVWLLCGREAMWTDTLPPRPTKMMHQLMALSDGPRKDFFDSDEFATKVEEALKTPGRKPQ